MITIDDVIEVGLVDVSKTEKGRYKSEYLGKIVYETTSDSLYVFNQKGDTYMCMPCLYNGSDKCFSPSIFINKTYERRGVVIQADKQRKDSTTEGTLQFCKDIRADDLIKLREKFDIDEIIKLREHNMI